MSHYVLNLVGPSQTNHKLHHLPKINKYILNLVVMFVPELPSKYLFYPPLEKYHQTCPSLQSVHVMHAIVVRYDEPVFRDVGMTKSYSCL